MSTSATVPGRGTFPRARAVSISLRIHARGIFLSDSLSKVVEDLEPNIRPFDLDPDIRLWWTKPTFLRRLI